MSLDININTEVNVVFVNHSGDRVSIDPYTMVCVCSRGNLSICYYDRKGNIREIGVLSGRGDLSFCNNTNRSDNYVLWKEKGKMVDKSEKCVTRYLGGLYLVSFWGLIRIDMEGPYDGLVNLHRLIGGRCKDPNVRTGVNRYVIINRHVPDCYLKDIEKPRV